MERHILKRLVDTETSIQGWQPIKPCLKQQDSQQKSTNDRQSSISFLKNSILRDFNHHSQSKMDDNQSEVSLEQDILDDHKQTLQHLFKKNSLYFQQEKSLKKILNKNQQFKSAIFKEITLEHYLHILLQKLTAKKPALVNLFRNYLKVDKIFFRFLQHLYYSYPAQIVHRVFRYIFYTWQLYYPFLHKQIRMKDVQATSIKISEKIMRTEEGSRSYSPGDNQVVFEQKRHLIEVLTLTIVLVMEKCFSNPYLTSVNLIQKSSEAENLDNYQQGLIPNKIIKRDEDEV